MLDELLRSAAARAPERDAIRHAERRLSYRELDELSGRIAGALGEAGIGRGDRVALHADKSIEAVIAIFGILKAGAAYVPLDPTAPERRIRAICEDGAIAAAVTTRARRGVTGGVASVRWQLVLDEDAPAPAPEPGPGDARVIAWPELARGPAAAPPRAPEGRDPEDLAYVLYTSGSTGEPKGVMLSHRAGRAFVDWAAATFALGAGDRISSHAPLHFDLSIFDLFATIAAGGTVVLVPAKLSVFPQELARFIAREELTVWYSVPSVLCQLVAHGGLGERAYPALRAVLFAGEVFALGHLRELAARWPAARLYNLYGPTETNVCTYHPVDRATLGAIDRLPIGRPCAGDEALIVDDAGGRAAIGEIGELCVTGPTLMTGYFGRPPALVSLLGHDRVYRTGDLAALGEDGELRFFGRRDTLVKSRGYRVELGAIEAVLARHADVAEAAVVAIPDEVIGNALRAFVVRRAGAQATAGALRAACLDELPPYMVPEVIELCAELPRTSTGKLDRMRLSAGAPGDGRGDRRGDRGDP